jgi:hypothetical protein
MPAGGDTSEEDDPIKSLILKPAAERFGTGSGGREPEPGGAASPPSPGAAAAAAGSKRARRSASAASLGGASSSVDADDDDRERAAKKQRRKERRRAARAAAQAAGGEGERPSSRSTPAVTGATPSAAESGSDADAAAAAAAGGCEAADGRHHVRAPPAGASASAAAAAAPPPAPLPTGVRIVEDSEAGNAEMARLLVGRAARALRYFEDGAPLKGVACWRCGRRGHVAKDCRCAVGAARVGCMWGVAGSPMQRGVHFMQERLHAWRACEPLSAASLGSGTACEARGALVAAMA